MPRKMDKADYFAQRVMLAFVGPTNRARDAVAKRILDDLHRCVVHVDGNPGGPKELTLTLTLSGEVGEAVLRAASAPDPAPVERPAWHIRDGYEGPAPVPFMGVTREEHDAGRSPAADYSTEGHPIDCTCAKCNGCGACGSTASVHICPNAPEVVALRKPATPAAGPDHNFLTCPTCAAGLPHGSGDE